MTPEERAREIVDNDDWYEWVGEGYYLKPDTLAMNIVAAIRAAVEEAEERAARVADRAAMRARTVSPSAVRLCEEIDAAIRGGNP